jgi:hypothetical protein
VASAESGAASIPDFDPHQGYLFSCGWTWNGAFMMLPSQEQDRFVFVLLRRLGLRFFAFRISWIPN